MFFVEGHLQTSKVQFFDRVAHTSKLLRNDSSFELMTDYVLRRGLKLP